MRRKGFAGLLTRSVPSLPRAAQGLAALVLFSIAFGPAVPGAGGTVLPDALRAPGGRRPGAQTKAGAGRNVSPPYPARHGRLPVIGARNLLLQRVVILVPALADEDPVVQAWIAEERARSGKGRRHSVFLTGPPQDAGKPSSKGTGPRPADRITPAQLRAVAGALFGDALAERLHARLGTVVAPQPEVGDALRQLGLSPAEATDPRGADRLRAALDADAVLIPEIIHVVVREGTTRDVGLWAQVRLLSPRPSVRAPAGGETAGSPLSSEIIPVASAAGAGRVPFHSAYLKSSVCLAHDACRQAAALAVHALWTGETAPFMRPAERVAIVPVAAPSQADKLQFTPHGRRILPAAVRDLAPDVSERFDPDLTPLFADAVLRPDETRRALSGSTQGVAALWEREGRPAVSRVQALGKRLGVDYVLLGRVTDIEVDEGPSEQGTEETEEGKGRPTEETAPVAAAESVWEREASAEAVGALVRVSDGALLWQDRVTSILRVSSPKGHGAASTRADRQVVADAVHFALVQLQRRLRSYRASFEE